MRKEKIVIIRLRKPLKTTLNEELQWFGNSLGLFNLRDRDKSCFRVFIELLKAAKLRTPLSSDELAYNLGLSRGTVVHHINNLMEKGIVFQQKNRYILREANLRDLVQDLRQDMDRAYKEIEKSADKIDKMLGL